MRTLALFLCLALGLSACAAPAPIAARSGFSVVGANGATPNEPGWYVVASNPGNFAVAREGASPGETTVFAAFAFVVPDKGSDREFLQYIADRRAVNDNPSRFVILGTRNEFVTFKGTSCLKYRATSQDLKSPAASAVGPQYMKNIGYVCRHPAEDDLAIQFEASNRSSAREFPAAVMPMAERHFADMTFTRNGF